MFKIKKVVVLLMVLLLGFTGLTCFASVKAEDSNTSELAKAFAEASQEMSDTNSKDMNKALKKNTNVGNAWSYMGMKSSIWGMGNSTDYSVSYSTLKSHAKEDNSEVSNAFKSRYFASAYGYVLYKTGLDHSYEGGSTLFSMAAFGRFIFGGILLVVLLLSIMVEKIFGFALDLLNMANVTDWIVNGSNTNPNGPFATVAKWTQDAYNSITGLGMVGAGLCFAGAIVLALLGMRGTDNPREPGNVGLGRGLLSAIYFTMRRVFTMLALPLVMLTLYNIMLSSLQGAFSDSTNSVPQYAATTGLVNFKGWVTNSRLQLPKGISGEFTTSTSSGSVPIVKRSTVAAINYQGAGMESAKPYMDEKNNTIAASLNNTKNVSDSITNLISTWMLGDSYSASNYAAAVQSNFISNHSKDYADKKTSEIAKDLKKSLKKGYSTNGDLTANNEKDVKKASSVTVKFDQAGSGKGLSTLGLYNYLGTKFDNVNMYHNDILKMSGSANQYHHYSVGLVGRGIVSIGNYIFMLGVLLSGTILGFGYAYWTLKAVIESMPKQFGAILMSGLGTAKGFGMFVTTTFGAIISIGGTILIYIFTSSLLVSIGTGIDNYLFSGDSFTGDGYATILPAGAIGINVGASNAVYAGFSTLAGLLLLFIPFFFIKIMGAIKSLWAEWLDYVIRALTATELAAFGGGSMSNYTPLTNNHLGGVGMDGSNQGLGDNFKRGMGQVGAQNAVGGMPGMSGSPLDGGVTSGSMKRSNRMTHPRGVLGKLRNGSAVYNDQLRRRLAERGDPDDVGLASGKDKRRALAHTLGNMALARAGDAVDGAFGTNLGSDIRGIQDANIDDALNKFDKSAEERDALKNLANNDDQNPVEDTNSNFDDDKLVNHIANQHVADQVFDESGLAHDNSEAQDTFLGADETPLASYKDALGNDVNSNNVVGDEKGNYRDLTTGEQVFQEPATVLYGNSESGNLYAPGDVLRDENGNLYANKYQKTAVNPKEGTNSGVYQDAYGNKYNEDDVFNQNGVMYAQNPTLDEKVPVSELSKSGEYVDENGNSYLANEVPITTNDKGKLEALVPVGQESVQDMSYKSTDPNNLSYFQENEVKSGYVDSKGNLTDSAIVGYQDKETGQEFTPEALAQGDLSQDKMGNPTVNLPVSENDLLKDANNQFVKDSDGYFYTKDNNRVRLLQDKNGNLIESANSTGNNPMYTMSVKPEVMGYNAALSPTDQDGNKLEQLYASPFDNGEKKQTYKASDVKLNQPYVVSQKGNMTPVKVGEDDKYYDRVGNAYDAREVRKANFAKNAETGRYNMVVPTSNFVDSNGKEHKLKDVNVSGKIAKNVNGDFIPVQRNNTAKVVSGPKMMGVSGLQKVSADTQSMSRKQRTNRYNQAVERFNQARSYKISNPNSDKVHQSFVNAQAELRAAKLNRDARDIPSSFKVMNKTIPPAVKTDTKTVINTMQELQRAKAEVDKLVLVNRGKPKGKDFNKQATALKSKITTLRGKLNSFGVSNSVMNQNTSQLKQTLIKLASYINN